MPSAPRFRAPHLLRCLSLSVVVLLVPALALAQVPGLAGTLVITNKAPFTATIRVQGER